MWNVFEVNNKTPERRQWRRFSVSIVNFEYISHLFLWFLLLTLNKYMLAGNLWHWAPHPYFAKVNPSWVTINTTRHMHKILQISLSCAWKKSFYYISTSYYCRQQAAVGPKKVSFFIFLCFLLEHLEISKKMRRYTKNILKSRKRRKRRQLL